MSLPAPSTDPRRRLLLRRVLIAVAMGLLGLAAAALQAEEYERPPINYSTATPDNPLSRLQAKLAAGELELPHEPDFGYLRAVLQALDVPESSQMLVFSKTSLQRDRIAPETPRAIYFSDDVYVGFCQDGDVLELSAVDPQLGAVFYTLDQRDAQRAELIRQSDECLVCHSSHNTQSVPGHLVRSVFADARGFPILSEGSYRIDHTSPLEQRWGGWYVTGTHGEQHHLGNMIFQERRVQEQTAAPTGLNVTELHERVSRAEYLTPHSDLVALMVLEHQTQAHNFITKANFQTRRALYYEASLNRELGEPADNRWDSTTSRIRSACEPLVEYLLFVDEAPLTAPLSGTSGFAEEFVKHGPRDARGRSLRDFDLQRRLFRYPCSYLIYSPSFDALPAEAKEYVYRRMWEVLSGEDTDQKFAHLSADDRRAIVEILRATKEDLPDNWRK